MIDIRGGEPGPAGALSNFCAYPFIFDGVRCAGAEGLIQSFKFDDPKVQREICGLVGREAKFRGRERDVAWKKAQRLWWQGQEYDRHSEAYQHLLDRLFGSLSENPDFRIALLASGDEELTHSIGKADSRETVLTEQEFCSRLIRLRHRLAF